jgi:hypothetical protein
LYRKIKEGRSEMREFSDYNEEFEMTDEEINYYTEVEDLIRDYEECKEL